MSSPFTAFQGSVPAYYDSCLGPLLFEPYALDLAARLPIAAAEHLLELACGTGRVTKHVIGLTAAHSRIVATDLNADMLKVAKEKVPGEKVQWQVADAQSLPFSDNSFTAIVCQFGVMFFPEKQKAFEEAYRVLLPGGLFLFNTWDAIELNPVNLIIQKVLREVLAEDAPEFLEKGPFSFYDKDIITTLLNEAGFHQVHIEVVAKTGRTESVGNVVDGFLMGTPLAAYLNEKEPETKQEIRKRITQALSSHYGETDLHIPMQALVCSAVK